MTSVSEALERLRPLLASAHDHPELERVLRNLAAAGEPALVALGELLAATRRRDAEGLARVWASAEAAALRADPAGHFVGVWCRRWTLGVPAVRAELRSPIDVTVLPPRWRDEWRHLAAWAELLADRTPAIDMADSARISLVPRQAVPVVECRVSGRRAYFILDTGAPTSVIALRRASELGVEVHSADARTSTDGAGHSVCLYPAVAPELRLGGVGLTQLPLHAAALDGIQADGILSPLELFRDFAVEVDAARGEIGIHRVLPRPLPPRAVNLVWQEGSPLVAVAAHGSAYSFLVDTGAGANLLCQHVAQELGLLVEAPEVSFSATAVGRVPLLGSVSIPWELAHVAQDSTRFTLKPCAPSPEVVFGTQFDGYLGWPWFASRRVIFADGGRSMHF